MPEIKITRVQNETIKILDKNFPQDQRDLFLWFTDRARTLEELNLGEPQSIGYTAVAKVVTSKSDTIKSTTSSSAASSREGKLLRKEDSNVLSFDHNSHEIEEHHQNNLDEKPLLLEFLRQDILPFSGAGNARQWVLHIDAKFSELQLSFQDRIDLLPYFFTDEAIIWFSLNKNTIRCYTDFCQLFTLEYLKKEYSINCCNSVEQINNSSLRSPVVVNEHLVNPPIGDSNVKAPSIDSDSVTSADSKNVLLSTSTLSPTISKALIDRFVKDPIKFYGRKDHVITWLDEIEQQFKIMNLRESDKLNLIHICLKGEAHQWYKQCKEQLIS
ncbi:unnamed protein product [Didymodactylos carnosus]|uniref:Retrotransposon gag domain-containing protein n=1 Tax=Didymodactylos carnosus TaxID=1234261 RepID=A0A8S2J2X2_9BILA|nr:unnamed protein product [Didymodactylos carnosus]CAF3788830.1 unnamed protein product [Didymodactylos carnosus]